MCSNTNNLLIMILLRSAFIYTIFFLLLVSFSCKCQDFKLRKEVHNYLAKSNKNFNFAMIAEAHRNDTAVAFFWPCIIDSELVDDKVMAVVFEKENLPATTAGGQTGNNQKDDNKWVETSVFISSKPDGKENLKKIFGNNNYTVIKPDGISKDSLAEHLQIFNSLFQKYIQQKKPDSSVSAIEQFSRAFGFNLCVYNNFFATLIMRGLKYVDISELSFDEKKESGVAHIYFEGIAKRGKIKLVKQGTGWTIDAVEFEK